MLEVDKLSEEKAFVYKTSRPLEIQYSDTLTY